MSDNENEDDIQEIGFLEEEENEEFESEDNFSITNVKNNILEKNEFYTENGNEQIMKKIIKLHENLGINDDELISEIRICVINKILDIHLIKLLSEFASRIRSSEKIEILKLIYKFISSPEFDENHIEKIRKQIPIILEENDPTHNDISFRDIFIKIKTEIILTVFDINDKYIKEVISKCVEKNWSLTSIKIFQNKLKVLYPEKEEGIKDEKLLEERRLKNEEKRHVIDSLLNSITAFPMDKTMLDMENIDFKNIKTIARDFYLKCSTTSDCPKKELNIKELLTELENLNLNYFSNEKIERFKHQINKAQNTKRPDNYNSWIEKFKKYDFKSNNKYEYIAEALGVISFALEEKKKFSLRTAQLLAIFIFIDNNESQEDDEQLNNEIIIENEELDEKNKIKKDKGKGIIEQISTGEGKSAIISCLSAFFGLRGHKVDIITSSTTLAIRDSLEFKEFYQIFNLDVDYVKDYQPAPYKADITYGTFLNFEGDLLEEISSNKIIRGDRPYDIIIIDEVDNAFIDCIQGSTQLTHSSKGYQFLIPMYVSIYLMIDLLDNMYLKQAKDKYEEIMARDEFKNLDENSKRNILEEIINNDDKREEYTKFVKKFFEDIQKESKSPNELQKIVDEDMENFEEMKKEGLKNYLVAPEFLNKFIQAQLNLWTNNAYCAKKVYKREIDYTTSFKSHDGYESITPIDKKNTGELEFNTVYNNGLHQMLQIKECLRVKPETLTHTFLSHISFFINYKKKNFFGLTGTIGGEETYSIYKNDYFNSNLVFIPSYMAKRFIELPAIICENDSKIHMNTICDEIFYHFSKGRKILVICKDINEGLNIDNKLHEDKFVIQDPTINNNIFLYLRNDEDDLQEELIKTQKRIIISTNLGGRGTDIKTSPEQEKNGGLHVIITKLSSNSRTQKQAFGRTSRKGNKGSGQFIITKKKNLKSYCQLIQERNKKEKEIIKKINLDELFLKDKLFKEYVECLKKYPELNTNKGKNTKDEIDERWSFFLKENFKDEINQKEIRKNFNIFISEIDKLMTLPRYERFNNDFLRITDAFNFEKDEDVKMEELFKFLIFKDCEKCFYFSASYLKSVVEWEIYNEEFKDNLNNPFHCLKIIIYLSLTKIQIKKLIKINIEPTLRSIRAYHLVSKTKYFKENKNYQDTAFYKQFETRKKILNNLIENCDKNIRTTQEYIRDFLPKNSKNDFARLYQEIKPMKECLMLQDEEQKELIYLNDAGLDFTYELSIRKPVLKKSKKYIFVLLGFFISFVVGSLYVPFISRFTNYLNDKLDEYTEFEYVDIHEEKQSLFVQIKNFISEIFQSKENENQDENDNANVNQHELQNDNNNDNNKNDKNNKKNKAENISKANFIDLKEKTLNKMKKTIIEVFNEKIKEIMNELKFLVFIDYFFKEETWKDLIILNIIPKSFNTYKMLLRKGEIIKMFNKENEHLKAITELNKEIEIVIDKIINEIKFEFNKEGYEQNKVKSLEHIIIRKRLGDIDYETSLSIVNQILTQNILNDEGKFTKALFKKKSNQKNNNKEKDKIEENKKRIQFVNIFYNSPYPKEIKSIKNIEDFTLTQFELSLEHDLILQDVNIFYIQRNYKNPVKKVFSDFTNGIKDIIIELFNKSTEDITEKFDSFAHAICQKIYEKFKTYLEFEIFPNILVNKSKTKKKKLNDEEQKIVNLIHEGTEQKAFDIMEMENFKQFFQEI